MLYSTLLPLLTALTALAHPGEQHEELSVQERHSLHSRQIQARNCQPQIARYIEARKAKRSLMRKRTLPDPVELVSRADGCVLTPEVTEGPYYINDELVRSNLIEDLSGVNATIDIQLLDSSTCEPVTNAFVELWAASPQGEYSGYGSASTSFSTAANAKRQAPSTSGGGMTGGGGGTSALTDSGSFLRGGNVVDENGNVTLTTLYPGFYTGRTAHIHVMVHSNYSINSNGTLASREGQLLHVGQMFFQEEYNYLVFNTSDYQGSGNTRTYNSEDSILASDTATGFSPYAQVELVGNNVTEGVNIYQVLVVDTSASYSVTNTNFAPTFTYVSDYTSETTAISNSSSSGSGSGASGSSSSSSSTSAATTSTTSSSSTSNGEWTAKSGGLVGMVLATLGGGLMIWWL